MIKGNRCIASRAAVPFRFIQQRSSAFSPAFFRSAGSAHTTKKKHAAALFRFFMLIRLKIPAFYGKIRFLLLFSFTSLWYYKM